MRVCVHLCIILHVWTYCVYAARKWVWQRCCITLWMPSGIYHCIYVSMYPCTYIGEYMHTHMLAAMYKHTHTHTHVITHNPHPPNPPLHTPRAMNRCSNLTIYFYLFVFIVLFLFDGPHISWARPTPQTLQLTARFLPHAATHCIFLFLFDRHYSQWPLKRATQQKMCQVCYSPCNKLQHNAANCSTLQCTQGVTQCCCVMSLKNNEE